MTKIAFTFILLLTPALVLGAAIEPLGGEPVYTRFVSPNGVEEHCIAIAPMPGGDYSDADRAQERAFCAIDFYTADTGLCPKTWSTSPGTMVYGLDQGPYQGQAEAFEREVCPRGFRAEMKAAGEPVAYKLTMNGADTSATFSTASLLYYQFSRWFHTAVHVPVSVYRSMDKDAHRQRVTRRGLELSAHSEARKLNHAAWKRLDQAEAHPASYHPTDELFGPDRKTIYGIFIHPKGTRYGAEVNGTRKSGWGAGQNKDFQRTAPFLALRSELPLQQAIRAGIDQAKRDPILRKAIGSAHDPRQMAFWMQELTEITLLDYIFSQQDRIGNIDYRYYWYWVDGDRLRHRLAHGPKVPADIAAHKPLRLRRTWLNDNDAGGRLSYANYTKKTGMLDKIRHYNPQTYRRLMALARDFAGQGPLYAYLRDRFGLTKKQVKMVVDNTRSAAQILQSHCEAGKLTFDLDPEIFYIRGTAQPQRLDCSAT